MRLFAVVVTIGALSGCAQDNISDALKNAQTSHHGLLRFDPYLTRAVLDKYAISSPSDDVGRGQTGKPVGTQINRSGFLSKSLAELDAAGALLLRPNDAKNDLACRAFFDLQTILPLDKLIGDLARSGSASVYRPTFWLTTKKPKELGDTSWSSSDCPHLLQNYDYGLAADIMKETQTQYATGPLLLFQKKDIGTPKTITFDLAAHVRPKDFASAFETWQRKIATDPELWQRDDVMKADWAIRLREFYEHLGRKGADVRTYVVLRSADSVARQ